MKSRLLWTSLSLMTMAAIFYFSAQDGASSSMQSSWVLHTFFFWLPKEYGSLIVRKLAHFSIYLLLGFNVFQTCRAWNRPHPWLAWIFCILYACSDEFHQAFSDGRAASWLDVGIDSLGSLSGLALSIIMGRISHSFRHNLGK